MLAKWKTYVGMLPVLMSSYIHASNVGIIGGYTEDVATNFYLYSAYVAPNGALTPFFPLNTERGVIGNIFLFTKDVAMNASGTGLIGGSTTESSFSYLYSAIVTPNGATTPLFSLNSQAGVINSCALTPSNAGLIGGSSIDGFGNDYLYAALVAPSGALTSFFPLGTDPGAILGLISSCALDPSGLGLIGGSTASGSSNYLYASYVSSNGTLTPIAIFTAEPEQGNINSCDLNPSGTGLIGGSTNNGNNNLYAALVAPDGAINSLFSLNSQEGAITDCAINSSGSGLLAGVTSNGGPQFLYAAFVAPNGALTPVFPLYSQEGVINCCDLNAFGEGLIGGYYVSGVNQLPYASFVATNGTLTQLSLAEGQEGIIVCCAIDPSGAGLIGGWTISNSKNYVYSALVAPNGAITPLFSLNSQEGEILNCAFPDFVVPASVGPFSSPLNSTWALQHAFEMHYVQQKTPYQPKEKQAKPVALLADAGDDPLPNKEIKSTPDEKTCLFWLSLFGDEIHQKARQAIPSFTNKIAGTIAAVDYTGIQDVVIGGGLAFVYNYVHYTKGFGHASIYQEYALFYASLTKPYFYMNAALSGGPYQFQQKRYSIASITSKAHPHGWLLCPHLEFSTPFYAKEEWLMVDPFVMFDWANAWQSRFHEHGSSGFNVIMKSQYVSMLRSEVGLRLKEIFQYGWGQFIIEEKGSYVNKIPTCRKTAAAAFPLAISTFPVDTFSSSAQNLGVVEVQFAFVPSDSKYPYGSISYQGEFGSAFQSQFLGVEIGIHF